MGGGARPGPTPSYKIVDLGLPSGTKWATNNLDPSQPDGLTANEYDFGAFYSWGNTEGHQEGSYDFSQANYNATPGSSILSDLTKQQDAAAKSLGRNWRMPTKTQWKELETNCTRQWATKNGVHGLLLTSNINGRQLFIPAAGRIDGQQHVYPDTYAYYWSRSYNTSEKCYCMLASTSWFVPEDADGDRFNGFPIRPVQQ